MAVADPGVGVQGDHLKGGRKGGRRLGKGAEIVAIQIKSLEGVEALER